MIRRNRPFKGHAKRLGHRVAVPVFAPGQRTVRCALALQAPAARMTLIQARLQLPRLQVAAQALARTLG